MLPIPPPRLGLRASAEPEGRAAAAWTTVNKFADVAPELLMGVAVEVIVRGQASFLAGFLGVEDRFAQLVIGDFSLGSMASSIHEEWKHRALSGGH